MVRIGPDGYEKALAAPQVREGAGDEGDPSLADLLPEKAKPWGSGKKFL
jgi:hypothetical protein